MPVQSITDYLKGNAYPGRGILIGRTPDGTNALFAYFIMGRSENSRNRIFVEEGETLRTKAFDESRLQDPSLVIYAPVRVLGSKTLVTNGDQTDTIYELMDKQMTFEQALRTRTFEPDPPIFTPRISGILHFEGEGFNYGMSILKSADGNPDSCRRFHFAYNNPIAGIGSLIHTYRQDGNPPESFSGEPVCIKTLDDIDAYTREIWNALDEQNKISLYVRYISLKTSKIQNRLLNKHIN